MVFPVVISASILEEEGLTNFLSVPDMDGETLADITSTHFAYRNITIGDTETVTKITVPDLLTAATGAKSLHFTANNGSDFVTTGIAKVIIIVQGSGTTVTDFEIFEGNSSDTASTQKQDFPAVSLGADIFITSKVLSFASSKHVVMRINNGTAAAITGWVIQ